MSETIDTIDVSAPAGVAVPGQDSGPSLFDLAEQQETPKDGKPPDQAAKPAARPEWLPEQFWDTAKGEMRGQDLAKSWRDLRGKISQGRGEVPEKPEGYALPTFEGMPEGLVPATDPLWKEVQAKAHAAGMTQQQLAAVAEPYLRGLAQAQGAKSPEAQRAAAEATYKAEIGKLGPNGDALVRDIGGWLNGLASRGALPAQQVQALKGVTTADGILALAALRSLTGHMPIPTSSIDPDMMGQKEATELLREGYAKNDKAKIAKATARLAALETRGELVWPN